MPSWIPIGPSVVRHGQAIGRPAVSGRVTGIAIANGGTPVYIATANGGVWRSDDSGASWTSLMDPLPEDLPTFQSDSLACGAIAISPADSNRVYVGTGEAYGNLDEYFGVGPLRCDDGGRAKHWHPETTVSGDPLEGKGFYRLAVNPIAPEQVVAATNAGLYLRNGTGWSQVMPGVFTGAAATTDDTNTTFFAARQGGPVYQWVAAPTGGTLATNWTALSSGFPPVSVGKIALGVQTNNPNLVYALVVRPGAGHSDVKGRLRGIWRLDGATWTQVATPPVSPLDNLFGRTNQKSQGGYDFAIAVDPNNPNRIYLGGSTRHTDAGAVASLYRCQISSSGVGSSLTYTIKDNDQDLAFIGDTVHADIHAIEFVPGDSNKLWIGCDGGVFYTDNATGSSGTATTATISTATTGQANVVLNASAPASLQVGMQVLLLGGTQESGYVSSISGATVTLTSNIQNSGHTSLVWDVFASRNTGLATLQPQRLACHPTEEVPLYCGVQDNGTLRYTGEEAWVTAAEGDGGSVVVNWNDPRQVIRGYVHEQVDKASDGGQTPGSWTSIDVPLDPAESSAVAFYPPIVTTPPNPTNPTEANIVAFGSNRVWISETFVSNRVKITPSGDRYVGDWQAISTALDGTIHALCFASATILYAGTYNRGTRTGSVYRFVRSGGTWIPSTPTPPPPPPISARPLHREQPITSIAIDPSDATGNSIFVALGGQASTNGYWRVWHYDGSAWTPASGSASAPDELLMDVQYNTVIADPQTTTPSAVTLYAGADIGIWRSTDSGAHWSLFADGLPDAAVLDLLLHPARRLLWAATHGRGVYECDLSTPTTRSVQLYVRRSVIDRGDRPLALGVQDTTSASNRTIGAGEAPDIRVDMPDGTKYHSQSTTIDFFQFDEVLDEGEERQARAYVPVFGSSIHHVFTQVHNRGTGAANNVLVALLIAQGASPPDLPDNFATTLLAQSVGPGASLGASAWKVIGYQTLNNLRAGFPQVAEFDLDTGPLSYRHDYTLLTIVQSPGDPIVSTDRQLATLCANEPKVAYKTLHTQNSTVTTLLIVGGIAALLGIAYEIKKLG